MECVPEELTFLIFSYLDTIDFKTNIFVKRLQRDANKIYHYGLTSKMFYNHYQPLFLKTKELVGLISKYHAYQKEYIEYYPNQVSPCLYDMLMTGCTWPFAKSTFDVFSKDIYQDIHKIIEIMPECINYNNGHLRCRYNVTPFYAACINHRIPYDIIRLLLTKNKDIDLHIDFNNSSISVLTDLKVNELFSRYQNIKNILRLK